MIFFKIIVKYVICMMICTTVMLPTLVGAETTKKDSAGCTISGGQTVCSLDNPIKGDPKDVTTIIGIALKGVIGIIGAVVLVMFIYGGFNWLISAGNPDKIKTGRDTMMWAAIGLVAVFAAYGTLDFVFKNLFTASK